MWRPSLWAAAGLMLISSAGQTAEVPLDTMLSADASVPWRGVGRVNVTDGWNRGACTGALIAPDIVLTAAHCLTHHRTGKAVRPADIHFVAGWHKGQKSGHSQAESFVLHPDWPGVGARGPEAIAIDVALIRLADPLVQAEAEPFATASPPSPGEVVTLISYRADRPHALTRQDDCRFRGASRQILTLECAVTFGASGAPVFTHSGGEMRIFAVLSAKRAGRATRAYAAPVKNALERLLDRLP